MFVIYGKDDCPYCDKAKELLTQKEIPFNYINIMRFTKGIIENLKSKTKMNTVPIIYEDNDLIGGYTELVDFLDRKEKMKID